VVEVGATNVSVFSSEDDGSAARQQRDLSRCCHGRKPYFDRYVYLCITNGCQVVIADGAVLVLSCSEYSNHLQSRAALRCVCSRVRGCGISLRASGRGASIREKMDGPPYRATWDQQRMGYSISINNQSAASAALESSRNPFEIPHDAA
jgi:hypothetical protein